jgi:hypothetical protein
MPMKKVCRVMDVPANPLSCIRRINGGVDAGSKILHCEGTFSHDREGGCARLMRDQDKLRVMLVFWMGHNLEHAEEFRKWAQRAEAFGEKEVASKLEAAAEEMILPNSSLQSALDMLGGPLERN